MSLFPSQFASSVQLFLQSAFVHSQMGIFPFSNVHLSIVQCLFVHCQYVFIANLSICQIVPFQIVHFSNCPFFKLVIFQIVHFSNGPFFKWSIFQIVHFQIVHFQIVHFSIVHFPICPINHIPFCRFVD